MDMDKTMAIVMTFTILVALGAIYYVLYCIIEEKKETLKIQYKEIPNIKPRLLKGGFGWDKSKEIKKLFPSLIGFGWNKTWHGERVDYALNHKPQNDLEKLIYKQFYISLLNGETVAGFISNIKPLLKELGYNICSSQAYEKKTWVENGKFISAKRLKMIYRVNFDIFYQVSVWIDILNTQRPPCIHPYLQYKHHDFVKARPQHKAWHDIVLSSNDPWWNSYYPSNGWHDADWVRQVSKSEVKNGTFKVSQAPQIEYKKWVNKRTREVIDVPIGIHPGFNVNFYTLYQKKAGN